MGWKCIKKGVWQSSTAVQQCKEDLTDMLAYEEFCLVLKTGFQQRMYLSFGKEKICFDDIHGAIAYDI